MTPQGKAGTDPVERGGAPLTGASLQPFQRSASAERHCHPCQRHDAGQLDGFSMGNQSKIGNGDFKSIIASFIHQESLFPERQRYDYFAKRRCLILTAQTSPANVAQQIASTDTQTIKATEPNSNYCRF